MRGGEDIAFAATVTSSSTTVGSVVVWGFTQQEWAIFLGMISITIAFLSLLIQAWVSIHKTNLYRAQTNAMTSGVEQDGLEPQSNS